MNNNQSKIYIFWLKYILTAFILFLAFRIIFFLIYSPQKAIPFFTYVQAIILGTRFDATSIAYLLLPIWIIVCISSCPFTRSKLNMICERIIKAYTILICLVTTLIYFLDLGLYHEHYTRINYLAFEYLDFIHTLIEKILLKFQYNILLVIIIAYILF